MLPMSYYELQPAKRPWIGVIVWQAARSGEPYHFAGARVLSEAGEGGRNRAAARGIFRADLNSSNIKYLIDFVIDRDDGGTAGTATGQQQHARQVERREGA